MRKRPSVSRVDQSFLMVLFLILVMSASICDAAPQKLTWFEVAVYNGGLEASFDVLPSFRSGLVSAGLSVPNPSRTEYPAYLYDLTTEKFIWTSECNYSEFWDHVFVGEMGSADYGDYTLTLTFSDGSRETYTKNLQNVSVSPVSAINVIVNADGSANVSWTRTTSANQYYRVRARDATDQQFFTTGFLLNADQITIPASNLRCLEIGKTYRWLVRAYDQPGTGYIWPYNTVETREESVAYAPSNLQYRISSAEVLRWKGTSVEVYFDVRPGSRFGALNGLTSATVNRSNDGWTYTFDLTGDWEDLSTESYINRGWATYPALTSDSYGTYTLDLYFGDGYHQTWQKTLQQMPATPIDSSTMKASIGADGAMAFSWDLPAGVTGQTYSLRIRNVDGVDGTKEYFHSARQTDVTQLTATYSQLRALQLGQTYQWFIRAYDAGFNTMEQSASKYFVYDPFKRRAMPWIPLLLGD